MRLMQPVPTTPSDGLPGSPEGAGDVGASLDLAVNTLDSMVEGVVARLPQFAVALGALVAFWFLAGLARRVMAGAINRAGLSTGAQVLYSRLTRWFVLLVGGLVAMTIVSPSMNFGQIVGALGVGSVAIGFAFRDILENFIAGLLLLAQEPFRIGDQIVIDGHEGTVVAIETRATRIKTYDNRLVVIPNAYIFTKAVTINTAHPVRRSQFDVGIGYEDDREAGAALLLETVRGIEGVLEEPAPDVLTTELADSAVVLRARWWTDAQRGSLVHTQSRVVAAIKEALDANGFDMPFPVRTVYMHRAPDEPADEAADET